MLALLCCCFLCSLCMAAQVGMAKFPDSTAILLLYANYIIHVRKEPRSARTQLQLAAKHEPGVVERYMIFAALVRATDTPVGLQLGAVCVCDAAQDRVPGGSTITPYHCLMLVAQC